MQDEVRWHDGGGDYNHRIAEVAAHSLSISLACVSQPGQHYPLSFYSSHTQLDTDQATLTFHGAKTSSPPRCPCPVHAPSTRL
ncbi:hypothetical protein Pcinc_030400 [Petrolisthes cinctipes]|uniref:Uncharacterized protein n=1 Tax=Petrolisthes cinctipes TaxID=88211 RepID=A0AAE1EY75_PETCI|nr:hypothetical protein Pcinc_030400 [Petrolisthes cinctipes]